METLELENLKMSELSHNEKEVTNGGCDGDGMCAMGYLAAVGSFFSGVGDGILAGYKTFSV
jgi:hypothetical protein